MKRRKNQFRNFHVISSCTLIGQFETFSIVYFLVLNMKFSRACHDENKIYSENRQFALVFAVCMIKCHIEEHEKLLK